MKTAEPQRGGSAEPGDSAAAGSAALRPLRVLLLDEDAHIAEGAEKALREGYTQLTLRRVGGAQEFVTALDESPDIIIACFRQRDFDAARAIELLAELGLDIPLIIVMNDGHSVSESDGALAHRASDLIAGERMWRLRYAVPRAIERKRLLDDARRERARYRLTFDNVSVGIIVSHNTTELLSVNSTALRILGFADQESFKAAADPHNWANCASSEDHRLYVDRMINVGSVRDLETTVRRSDGEIIPVSISGRAMADPAREGWLILTVIEDLRARRQAESAMQASEERLSGLVDSARDGILMIDEQLRIVLANPAAQQMFGADRLDMLGETLREFLPDAVDQLLAGEAARREVRPQGLGVLAALARRRDGCEFPVEVSVSTLTTPGGLLYTAFVRDVTERALQEKRIGRLSRIQAMFSNINSAIVRMRERSELLRETCRIAVENGNLASGMVAMLTPEGTHNRVVAAFGPDTEVLIGTRYLLDLEDPSPHDLMSYAMRHKCATLDNDLNARVHMGGLRAGAVARGYKSTIILPLVVDDKVAGAIVLAALEAGFFTQDEVRVLEEMAADVSFALESIHKAERVNHLAFYDALTDLPNRNLFQERLLQILRRPGAQSSVVPVVLMDIERFRFVNETLGRHAGDELLKQVAARLRLLAQGDLANHVQEVARVAGNSFALALSGIRDADQATFAIKQILRQIFAAPFDIHGSELRVRSRCGVSLFPSDGIDSDQLWRNAEAALGNAKRSADAFLFYAPEMNAHAADVLALENKLRRAIEEEQFVLHYQPKVSVIDRSITGVEALIRWQDPDTGLVPPARFIPILEETGMIFEVGRWAMQQAIRDYKSWIVRGLFAPRIAVNISPLQLRHRDFLADIRRTLEEHAEAVVGLDFEITESMIMEDLDHNIEMLEQIQQFGINVAIDDFGTGYSSLSYLAKLPVTTLKIDRSFVVTMTQTPQGFAIVSTIIALAHALNLRVVAEGVETEEQAKFLRVLNCDEIQGYLISKPVPVDSLERLLAGNVAALHG